MPWIQNVALSDIQKGFHINPGDNAMLIQIVDPDMEFPVPKYSFKETHQFKFLDIEDDGLSNDGTGEKIDMSWGMVTEAQAAELARLLQHALDTEAFRSPNLLVKHRMMKHLGWTYDENEPHTINGVETSWGFVLPKGYEGDI